jgi:hypothetical protein
LAYQDGAVSKNYVIKKTGGYIVVVEGGAERHLEKRDPDPKTKKTIREIERLIKIRADAGVELSDILINDLGLTTASASYATLTTGAGDYDQQQEPTKKKK